ncbi:hypothetical protein VPNG_02702 [Cytospora leucostoma]|uniref:Uncharacterized protein n=1 Tax=Cytospora leucostoma TaxID=1230097 RepID=A0A423XJ97_9PEZI|nr:hypothetical protein VPNG_02702 [Cytospora leucostoma]
MQDGVAQKRDRFFVAKAPSDYDDAARSAREPVVFLDDHYSTLDADKLYHHAQNVARTFVADKALVRVVVLPLEGCSIGAVLFVLVEIVMMENYEERAPDIQLHDRLLFVGSFPISPHPFFDHKAEVDSTMLAFSDGFVLPFLLSHLDLEG